MSFDTWSETFEVGHPCVLVTCHNCPHLYDTGKTILIYTWHLSVLYLAHFSYFLLWFSVFIGCTESREHIYFILQQWYMYKTDSILSYWRCSVTVPQNPAEFSHLFQLCMCLNSLLWWKSVSVFCVHVCVVCLIICIVVVPRVLLGLDRWYSKVSSLHSRLHALLYWSACSQGTEWLKSFWYPRVSIISCMAVCPMWSCTMIFLMITLWSSVLSASTSCLLHSVVVVGQLLWCRLMMCLLPSLKCFIPYCTVLAPCNILRRYNQLSWSVCCRDIYE